LENSFFLDRYKRLLKIFDRDLRVVDGDGREDGREDSKYDKIS